MKYIKKSIITIFFLPLSQLFSMKETITLHEPPICDAVKIICKHLDLSSVSQLLRTCTTYHDIYSKGIPKSIADRYDQLTQDDVQKIQFGISRFLKEHPTFCIHFTKNQHRNALIHYAQTNNATMIEHIINHENSDNRNTRIETLIFFGYKKAVCDPKNTMYAYKAIAKGDSCMKKHSFFSACASNIDLTIFLKNGFSITKSDQKKQTGLHYAAQYSQKNNIKFLLKHGISINTRDSEGNTPLHLARTDEIVTLLLNNNANINVQNRYGWTPLHNALYTGKRSIALILLTHGADVTLEGRYNHSDFYRTPLEIAKHQGYHHDPELGPLLEAADPSSTIVKAISKFFNTASL